jgi:hypothetical protein
MQRYPANRRSVSSAVSMITNGRPDPLSTTIRFPTSVEEPPLAAEQVAAFTPASASAASSSAGLDCPRTRSSPAGANRSRCVSVVNDVRRAMFRLVIAPSPRWSDGRAD